MTLDDPATPMIGARIPKRADDAFHVRNIAIRGDHELVHGIEHRKPAERGMPSGTNSPLEKGKPG